MTRIEECILYRSFDEDEVLKDFTEMIEAVQNDTIARDQVFYRNLFYDALNRWWRWRTAMDFPEISGAII